MQLFPCIHLGEQLVILEANTGNHLMAISCSGSVFVWYVWIGIDIRGLSSRYTDLWASGPSPERERGRDGEEASENVDDHSRFLWLHKQGCSLTDSLCSKLYDIARSYFIGFDH